MTGTLTPAVSQRIQVTIGQCLNCDCEIVAAVDVRTDVKVAIQAEVGPFEISTDATSMPQGLTVAHACGTMAHDVTAGPYGG